MKFNKIYIAILALIATVSISCDPLEDEVNEIEASLEEVQDVEYTLNDDDYDLADEACDCAGFGNFGSDDDVKANIPLILEANFPALGEGSSALVNYQFFRGGSDLVDPYTDAERYVLSSDDYASTSAEANFFNEDVRVEDNISSILNANIDSPEDGELVAASFKESEADYSDFTFQENFDGGDLGEMDESSVDGDETWEWGSSSSGYRYAAMSGRPDDENLPNEDWLVTPALDLTTRTGGTTTLRITQVLAFLGDGEVGTDIAVFISPNYTGDVNTATWVNLTSSFNQFPTGDGADFDRYNTQVNLAAYEGMIVHVGFFYKSTADYSPLWRIADVSVDNGSPIDIVTKNVFYEYNESTSYWTELNNNAYFLSSADFDEMGGLSNFGSSISPDDYLPQFLNNFAPFAQEEDEQIIVYDYVSSSSGPQVRGDLYTFLNSEWVKYESEISTSLNFGHDGNTWVPDNTVKYTITAADFAEIGKAENGLGNPAALDNLNTFGNFGTQWSTPEIYEAIGFILKLRFPNSEVGQKYLVTYNTFPAGDLQVLLILDASGEYVVVE